MKEILIAKEGEICEAYDVRQERDVLVQMVRTLQERERDRGAGGAELKVAAAVQKFKGLFHKKDGAGGSLPGTPGGTPGKTQGGR